ncbi:nuclear pore complex protein nup98-nup96 [Anaeramoeba flamelloides]|uniref:Nuclear pore complex protein nup98-nup96 n=1 Tax=Anaeramoeba flamelloides TaxID=1746091 RepID=A0AAV7YU91_9EUKA|nr:nuclear pore complex protein nup98-nup96 [Anaeramoeba flamelloides]
MFSRYSLIQSQKKPNNWLQNSKQTKNILLSKKLGNTGTAHKTTTRKNYFQNCKQTNLFQKNNQQTTRQPSIFKQSNINTNALGNANQRQKSFAFQKKHTTNIFQNQATNKPSFLQNNNTNKTNRIFQKPNTNKTTNIFQKQANKTTLFQPKTKQTNIFQKKNQQSTRKPSFFKQSNINSNALGNANQRHKSFTLERRDTTNIFQNQATHRPSFLQNNNTNKTNRIFQKPQANKTTNIFQKQQKTTLFQPKTKQTNIFQKNKQQTTIKPSIFKQSNINSNALGNTNQRQKKQKHFKKQQAANLFQKQETTNKTNLVTNQQLNNPYPQIPQYTSLYAQQTTICNNNQLNTHNNALTTKSDHLNGNKEPNKTTNNGFHSKYGGQENQILDFSKHKIEKNVIKKSYLNKDFQTHNKLKPRSLKNIGQIQRNDFKDNTSPEINVEEKKQNEQIHKHEKRYLSQGFIFSSTNRALKRNTNVKKLIVSPETLKDLKKSTKYKITSKKNIDGNKKPKEQQQIIKHLNKLKLKEMEIKDNNNSKPNIKFIFKNKNYYTIPSQKKLLEMTKKERANIKNFVIGNKKYGEVVFVGLTNINKLDLINIIKFQKYQVIIYPQGSNKPGIGKGLNKLSIVKLFNCYPLHKDKKTIKTDINSLQKLEKKLRKNTKNFGGKFISYQNGTYIFSVPNF